tara:strand:+ start:533 stop:1108 length:576 start_codon:yes stop_codon:yes gene_type:complete
MSESIILIGNANVKENELFGETIDSFDNVVRFNRFETKNYEKYIGKKTTHWILNQDLYGKGLFEKKLQGDFDVKRYVITGAVPNKNTNLKNTTYVLGQNSKVFQEYKNFWGNNVSPTYKPDTGILTILYFVDRYEKVYLYNFDFGKTKHYFNSDKPNTKHDWNYSKKIVEHFIDKGRLKILNKKVKKNEKL